ncbi:MATE family efflux transporter [Paenalkalicoccus suaedae]|uniref:Probable multidrug resistance protein NorM n=1 Tax=Paenalkalicoccus suaedae TaxID=2592382 RepID=A0A859FBB6_9BACI|nr:MATE family efflux transporter [Paenalkalicoccus suaedae]QKS70559.1 MATE family efflux transporter [Paenalkalicoccus suaedae]
MFETSSKLEKLKLFAIVMWPILVTQVGLYMMNFIDTTMSGQAGAEDLAGVAIGSSLWVPILTGITGILLALTPILAQKIGAQKTEDISFYLMQGMTLALFISALVFIAGLLFLEPILAFMSLEENVAYIAKHYLIGLAVGMIPLFVYNVLRGFIDSLGQTKTNMFITLLALPVNALFNYLLIFGAFGFPELGGIGAGYATAITYWFIFIVTILVIHRVPPFSIYRVFREKIRISFGAWKEILLLGTPIGLTIFFETSIFSAVTLLMSQFSTEIIAAHQAAINFASLLYMVPISFAFTLTIAVGYEVGAKRMVDAKQYTNIGILLSIATGLIACVIIYVTRGPVATLYTNDPSVAYLIQQFLLYAIFFQLSDAINTPIQGVLRGYKDVNVPFIMALVSFWIIGLPLGYVLATYTQLGPYGYWVGLIAGLAVCATFLYVRLGIIQRRVAKIVYE